MSVLAFVETSDGKIKKVGLEAASYAYEVAKAANTEAYAIVLGQAEGLDALGQYGITKVFHVNDPKLNTLSDKAYTKAISSIAESQSANVVIIPFTTTGKSVSPRIAVRMQAGCVTGAISYPDMNSGFVVKKNVFSGKAIAEVAITSNNKVISPIPGALAPIENQVTCSIETVTIEFADSDFDVKVLEQSKITGTVPLSEAELVVSGGRGLKGPENWGIVEDLAKSLGASLACSRPVADSHWRPHYEHVGQTGGTIRPKLYIAIGISGAIQHLAGVNGSKCIVVINKDPEAPFFSAADFGVVGDAFEVVPRLTDAINRFKASEN